MADAVPPVATEAVNEAQPVEDGVTADPAAQAAQTEEAAGNKRKFEDAGAAADAGEDAHLHKRAALDTDAAAADPAEVADVTAATEVATADPAANNPTAEAAPAAPTGEQTVVPAAPEPQTAVEASAAPDVAAPAANVAVPAADGTQQEAHQNGDAAAAAPDPAAAAAAAQATASALTQSAGGLEQLVQIPGTMVGKLIGKQGETIKGLQYSTNTRIQIDHTTPGDMKNVTVTGTNASQVAQAVAQINHLMSDSGPGAGDVSQVVECPPGIVGRIIGRGGETIRSLQQASQAHIVVNQDFPEGHPRQVSITGKPDSVQRAVNMVNELIQGEPGSAQAIIQKYGAGISRALECPKGMVGRVIGKGGETIKALQKNFHCNIQIDQTSDPMTITIAGQPHTVDSAVAAVHEIINGGNPFGANAPPNFAGGQFSGGGAGAGGGYGQGGFGGGAAAYGGGYQPAPFAQPYGAPYGAPSPYGAPAYGAPAPYGGGYGGFPGAGDPYAAQQAGGYGAPAPGYGAAPAAAPAQSVWQELPDPEGRPYYYNTQTGVSQWEKPADMP